MSTSDVIFRSYVLKLGAVNLNSNDVKTVQDRNVETIIPHPRYKGSPVMVNDIALMKMNKKVMFTPFVRPLCLDYKGDFREESALAIGHGFTEYNRKILIHTLQYINTLIFHLFKRGVCYEQY